MFALNMELLSSGQRAAALGVVLAHHAYLRPSELLLFQWQHVCPPGRASAVLHPRGDGISSKVRELDETLNVDLQWVVNVLGRSKQVRPSAETLVPQMFCRLNLHAAALRLNVPRFVGDITMYRMMHSGSSADYAAQRRSIQENKHRGRWATDASVRHYQKGGRVNQLLGRCPDELLRYVAYSLDSLEEAFRHIVLALSFEAWTWRDRFSSTSSGALARSRRHGVNSGAKV